MAAANKAPGFGQGVPLPSASPMQVGMPIASPCKTLMYRTSAEEVLLHGATLLFSLQQEARLLGPLMLLTDNHLKMIDSCHNLDSMGLQFICESIEALRRERTPAQLLLGYTTPQVMDLQVPSTNSPMFQEVFQAAGNLGTMITSQPQVPPEQCPAQDHIPDPTIEDAIANMLRHEQALWMPHTDSHQ